jgi:large subunit ribosomal protein L10
VALRIEDKKAIVNEITDIANRSVSVIAAEYRGLTVAEMTRLRTNARKSGVVLRVYRNTLVRRAVEGTNFVSLQKSLVGPIVLMFSQDEPSAAARMVRDFAKENNKFEVRALVIDGRLLGPDQLKAVASLPSRNEALAQVMSVMKAPIVKLARTLSETYAQLVRVVAAVADKKRVAT